MNIGFSTGSIAKGNFLRAIELLNQSLANVIELSSLREHELDFLIHALPHLNLSHFSYVSFHAPSKLIEFSENQLLERLQKVADRGLKIVVHPDIMNDFKSWQSLGSSLCIENMDKRKAVGRTANDLHDLFDILPDAMFCLDLAHAKQVDPTMNQALLMIRNFSDKIVQVHLSDVNSQSHHEPLNLDSLLSYHKIVDYINWETPIILESPVLPERISSEILLTQILFDKNKFEQLISGMGIGYHSYSGHYYAV